MGGELALEPAAALGEPPGLFAQGTFLGIEPGERTTRFGNRALRIAQRISRFAPAGFLLVQPLLELRDAIAQLDQPPLSRRRRLVRMGQTLGNRAEERGQKRQDGAGERVQVFALPCADTAATRRATSSPSPR